MVMLFGAFAQIPPSSLRNAFRNRRVVGTSLVVNFVWNPLLAVGLGAFFLQDQPALWVGLIMLMVTPCTDWYLVFTDLAVGNIPLATSILPYNLILQLLLLPVYLYVFAGALVSLPFDLLVESVFLVLVVPLVAATVVRRGLVNRKGESWFDRRVTSRLAPVQILFLCLAIAAMFASQGEVVLEEPGVFALIAVPSLHSRSSTSSSNWVSGAPSTSPTRRSRVSTARFSRATPRRRSRLRSSPSPTNR